MGTKFLIVRSKQEANMARRAKTKATKAIVTTHKLPARSGKSYERKSARPITPTEYGGLQAAFDHFNRELFDGQLPDAFFVYQRRAHSAGHYAADRYAGRTGKFDKDEISLNPDVFIGKSDAQICQTVVHEMAHHWQKHLGRPSSRGYHNDEWSTKMETIGLQPSSTGAVGGNRTGQRMLDYPIPGGPFEQSYKRLAATGWKFNLESAHRPPGKKHPRKNKATYDCTGCGLTAWAKPDAPLVCGDCHKRMSERRVNPVALKQAA
jgi:predicted SprT family Zn-dependent metalloprotease